MECVACAAPFNSYEGITTSYGYVCYECVRWIHKVAYETRALAPRKMQEILAEMDLTE